MKVDLNGNAIVDRPHIVVISSGQELQLDDEGYVALTSEDYGDYVFNSFGDLVNTHKALGLAIKYGWLKEDLKVVEKE